MENMKILSFTSQVKLNYVLSGGAWVAAGIMGFFDNRVCLFLKVIFLVIAMGSSIVYSFSPKEKITEKVDIKEAEAVRFGYSCLRLILALGFLIFMGISAGFITFPFDWNKLLPNMLLFVLGLADLIIGLVYLALSDDDTEENQID